MKRHEILQQLRSAGDAAVPPGDTLPRHVCDACETIHYQNPRMVVGCIVEWEDRVLLCQRGDRAALRPVDRARRLHGERRDRWPSGAIRETLEEANARVEIGPLYARLQHPARQARSTSCSAPGCSTRPQGGRRDAGSAALRGARGAVGRDRVRHREERAHPLLRRSQARRVRVPHGHDRARRQRARPSRLLVSASTIFSRAARTAGRNPPASPIASANASDCSRDAGRQRRSETTGRRRSGS